MIEKHDTHTPLQFMLLPSLQCQAACRYCFGPNRGGMMPLSILDTAVQWIRRISAGQRQVRITFHGGEPLLAGIDWYRRALPQLQDALGPRLRLALQSNLWAMDDDFASLFKHYGVCIGTSLDGPRQITDPQRGPGYFDKTMRGIHIARAHGIEVGVICTFTRASQPFYRDVCDFFADQGMPFSVHGALQLGGSSDLCLSAADLAHLYPALFRHYLAHISRLQIHTFDLMAQGMARQSGCQCTFTACAGTYLAIVPDGDVYPCNRFAGNDRWRMGNIRTLVSRDAIAATPAMHSLRQRQQQARQACEPCPHVSYCLGGCPYHAVLAGHVKDPACEAFKRTFDLMAAESEREMFSPANLEAIAGQGADRYGLLRKGPLIQIMRGGLHPALSAAHARETLAATAAGVSRDAEETVAKLEGAGLITHRQTALAAVRGLFHRLRRQISRPINCYLHITSVCNLACSHCYARSHPGSPKVHLPPATVAALQSEAAENGFLKFILTGGEPMMHPDFMTILTHMRQGKSARNFLSTVLRTNLTCPLSTKLLKGLAAAFDEIVVSIDGGPEAHDRRRGKGTYEKTVSHLRRLKAALPQTRVSIAAVMSAVEAGGRQAWEVRELGAQLGIPVRLRPLLPLGRAAASDLPMYAPPSSSDTDDPDRSPYPIPSVSCGLGLNMSITPTGEVYPCHVMSDPRYCMGNIGRQSLKAIMASEKCSRFRAATVDRNRQCARCALRYLCGGFCRAWSLTSDPDAPPQDCSPLFQNARQALERALDELKVPLERWIAAGLPFPDHPPRGYPRGL